MWGYLITVWGAVLAVIAMLIYLNV
jgi:hypothetical protein